MIHHLTSRDYTVMPWKNGGGSTTELAIFPDQASVQSGFDWRISLADLDGSGPFSRFPGYDRIITQISGPPMVLLHEGWGEKLLRRNEPYHFAGEMTTVCELHGRAQDFNIMTRRGLTANCEVLSFPNHPLRRAHSTATTFIWVAFGSAQVHESSKGHDHRLDPHDALRITGEFESVLTIKPRDEDTLLFLITIA
jgi:environmental stress-induced protein Ves